MKHARLILATLLTASAGLATGEGPSRARLAIGEEQYRVPIGKPFAVMLGGERVTMRIEVEETEAFAESGVRFRYPAGFRTRRDDGDENVTVWTIEGDSAAIVVQQYRDALDAESLSEALAATIVERHGAERVTQKGVTLKGAGRTYPGSRLVIAPASGARVPTETEQNLFAFENTEGVFSLIAQDNRRPGAGPSKEFKELVRLLGETFDGGEAPEREEPPAEEPPADESADEGRDDSDDEG